MPQHRNRPSSRKSRILKIGLVQFQFNQGDTNQYSFNKLSAETSWKGKRASMHMSCACKTQNSLGVSPCHIVIYKNILLDDLTIFYLVPCIQHVPHCSPKEQRIEQTLLFSALLLQWPCLHVWQAHKKVNYILMSCAHFSSILIPITPILNLLCTKHEKITT